MEIESVKIELIKQNEKLFITTLELSKFLKKQYIRDIENIKQNIKHTHFFKLNHFIYLNESKMYLLDKEGFIFLINQYRNNPPVCIFKEKYYGQIIDQFILTEANSFDIFSSKKVLKNEKKQKNIKEIINNIETDKKMEKHEIINNVNFIKIGDKLFTTSLNVAVETGIKHAHLFRKIEKLALKFKDQHFLKSSYMIKDKEYLMYNIDREGSMLLINSYKKSKIIDSFKTDKFEEYRNKFEEAEKISESSVQIKEVKDKVKSIQKNDSFFNPQQQLIIDNQKQHDKQLKILEDKMDKIISLLLIENTQSLDTNLKTSSKSLLHTVCSMLKKDKK